MEKNAKARVIWIRLQYVAVFAPGGLRFCLLGPLGFRVLEIFHTDKGYSAQSRLRTAYRSSLPRLLNMDNLADALANT